MTKNVLYFVCPRCGHPLTLVNRYLTCKVCGYRATVMNAPKRVPIRS